MMNIQLDYRFWGFFATTFCLLHKATPVAHTYIGIFVFSGDGGRHKHIRFLLEVLL